LEWHFPDLFEDCDGLCGRGLYSRHLRVVDGAGELPERVPEQSTCHTVTRESADWVEKSIVEMLEEWRVRRDERALRGAIGRLIAGV